ncbi:RNA polymerase Rpb8-domain-containing protein [Chytriomyces sp. MP71]|nr:RNA polymerase Rpb8-domain-containing protein [Chytriomyces sp. MP71]
MVLNNIIFTDIFEVGDINRGGKKFDRGAFFVSVSHLGSAALSQIVGNTVCGHWKPMEGDGRAREAKLTADDVSRLNATSEAADTEIILDINTEIYPMSISDKFTLSLATSLSLDDAAAPSAAAKKESWRDTSNQSSLADEYEYVMFGKVYKYDETGGKIRASVYVSFGGLLLVVSGEPVDVLVGQELYLLMRKN